MKRAGGMLPKDDLEQRKDGTPVAQPELPIVARLVVEIRSDGRRTMARGAMEDATTGEKVELKAEAPTPFLLIASLLKSLGDVPQLVKTAASRLLPGKKR
jgi:hypothetical protein